MNSRRDFIKKSLLMAAGGGVLGGLPASIQKAFAIDPQPGTTFLDAEHVVILMQENRSFDHMFGKLRGVRGFNDPRAMTLPNGNPVWLQSNSAGETYAPFRFDIKASKVTWMGSLPHSWVDQGGARNEGRHNRWLDFKRVDNQESAHLPLTMGHYEREDLPFFYAFADAFTVCDQNFCSSLTATTPNRLHLWTGTTRAAQNGQSWANVRNDDLDYDSEVTWPTFPERLEDHGISWRVYQNELSLPTGLEGEHDALLTNFGDNVFEWFTQYRVRFLGSNREFLLQKEKRLAAELNDLEAKPNGDSARERRLAAKRGELEKVRQEQARWSEENFAKLSAKEQNIHLKAFTTNAAHPSYRELDSLKYSDGEKEHEMPVPKGDVLHQFREDVANGKLPTVSWLVPPERFSDHPSSAWFGAWYLSETLDILTENPEVWKKTILILCYDENDGYFDHVPPFIPPAPGRPETGSTSAGIDTSLEHVTAEQHREIAKKDKDWAGVAGPIGLGFRVPLVIASPWSRGGYVCSQVFDHTSILQFLEKLLTHKTGREVRETNISAWRRTVCGDLTSVFQPYSGEKIELPKPVDREPFFETISRAQFRPIPDGFKKLAPGEIVQTRENPRSCPWLPRQESGVRPARALPYELAADGRLSADRKSFVIEFSAGRERFGDKSAGAPFHVSTTAKLHSNGTKSEPGRTWDYAVAAGDRLTGQWALEDFTDGNYYLHVYGPNGFYREFRGSANDPLLGVALKAGGNGQTASNDATLLFASEESKQQLEVVVEDLAYGGGSRVIAVERATKSVTIAGTSWPLERSHGWYDFRITIKGIPGYAQRYAGRVETGAPSFSDPQMA